MAVQTFTSRHRMVGASFSALALNAVLVLALVLLAGCGGSQSSAGSQRGEKIALDAFPTGLGRGYATGIVDGEPKPGPLPKKGDPAPNFSLVLPDGRYATVADLKGKPVVINFWATWCGPCRLEMPELLKAAAENKDVVVLPVNVQEARSNVEPFAQEFKIELPIVLDSEGNVQRLYQVKGLPTTYFIDRDGKVASLVAGPLTPKVLAQRLAEIQ